MRRSKAHIFTVGLLFSLCGFAEAQSEEFEYPNFKGESLNGLSNYDNWNVIEEASGYLNLDDFKDYVIILESSDLVFEKQCVDCGLDKKKPRIIVVLFGHPTKTVVSLQNNVFIARQDEGGMLPHLNVNASIVGHKLNLEYQYTRDKMMYVFESNANKLTIVFSEQMTVHPASGNYQHTVIDFHTKTIVQNSGNIESDSEDTKTFQIKVKPKTLSDFGRMYEWEIAPNIFL